MSATSQCRQQFSHKKRLSERHNRTRPKLGNAQRVAAVRTQVTPGGELLQKNLRIVQRQLDLQYELDSLRALVHKLMAEREQLAIDTIRTLAPKKETLRLWAAASSPPAYVTEAEEEKPW
jgi:hypothetical protein